MYKLPAGGWCHDAIMHDTMRTRKKVQCSLTTEQSTWQILKRATIMVTSCDRYRPFQWVENGCVWFEGAFHVLHRWLNCAYRRVFDLRRHDKCLERSSQRQGNLVMWKGCFLGGPIERSAGFDILPVFRTCGIKTNTTVTSGEIDSGSHVMGNHIQYGPLASLGLGLYWPLHCALHQCCLKRPGSAWFQTICSLVRVHARTRTQPSLCPPPSLTDHRSTPSPFRSCSPTKPPLHTYTFADSSLRPGGFAERLFLLQMTKAAELYLFFLYRCP